MKVVPLFFSALTTAGFFITCFPHIIAAQQIDNNTINLNLSSRIEVGTARNYRIVTRKERWDPKKTAVIICDMWDRHWCKSATERVAELAPHINEVITNLRKNGVLIIHCPSRAVDFYEGTPMRKRAQNAPKTQTIVPLKNRCRLDPAREPPLPIDDSDGGCFCEPKCKYFPERKSQIETIKIEKPDAVTDNLEACYLLKQRGIKNIIIMGVHTGMCVLDRPFGIRQMVYQGKNVVLMRDLTDCMYSPKRFPYVDHFTGTDLIVEHIEKYWCPTVTSADIFGGKPFKFKDDNYRTKPEKSQLQVSVGDFRIVVKCPIWPWGLPADANTFHEGYRESVAQKGQPCYLRPPRDAPVHASMPNLIRHPVTGDILMRYTPYHDAAPEHRMSGICVSSDGGWNWTRPVLINYVDSVGPFKNGWIGLSYIAGLDPNAPQKPKILVLRSDDGIEWVADEKEAPITFPENIKLHTWKGPLRGKYEKSAAIAIYKQIIEYKGLLYATGYGEFNEPKTGYNILIKSDDEGKSWHFVSIMGQNYEPTLCMLPDGDMIAIHRCDLSREPRPLLQSRSTDGGLSFSKAVPAPGVELITNEDRKWFTSDGRLYTHCSGAQVDPTLLRMGNGVIAVSYGRPGLHIRFSIDGKGQYWSNKTTILTKYGRTDGKTYVFPIASQHTHSYSGMASLSDRTLLLTSNIYGYSPQADVHKGRDVIFVVPVSVRKPTDKDNLPPTIKGQRVLTCRPGRKITAKFTLYDPDGDWVRLVCPRAYDVEVEANTITWRMPFGFKGQKQIRIIAEDAWGCRSEPLILKITKASNN